MYNVLLQRQIKKYLGGGEIIPDEYRPLLTAINESYNHYEADRNLIERSMDLSSLELIDVNRKLREEADRHRIVLGKLRQALQVLRLDEGDLDGPDDDENFDDSDLIEVAELLRKQIDRRHEAEGKLLESEARFRLLAENSTDIIGRYSPDGNCLYLSPSCRSLLGYDPEELIGRRMEFGIHPADASHVAEISGMVGGATDVTTSCFRFLKKDGDYIWLETTMHAIRDAESGEMMEVHTASRDITARKRDEEELQLLSLVASKTDNAVLITNRLGQIEWVNESFIRFSGYTLEEAVGYRPSELLHGPLTSPETLNEINTALWNARPITSEILYYHKNGHTYWLSATITPILDAAGQVERFVAIQSDITERKQIAMELQYRSSRLTALVENLQAGVLVEDESERVVVMNQTFCDMFDIRQSPHDLVGKESSGLAEGAKRLFADPDGFVNRVNEVMAGRKLCIDEELVLTDGRIFERDYIPIFVGDIYRGHLWHCRDVTERKMAQAAINALNSELKETNHLLRIERDKEKEHVRVLEELNQMKSEFVSSVSHELRTPLASIIGFTQTILIDPDLPTEMQREFLQIVFDEAKRLAKLINDMLDLSRIESGSAIVEKCPTDVIPLVERGIQSVVMQAESRGISLTSVVDRPSLIANVDPDRTLQVIINLLSNAVKFTPDGGWVQIRARVEGSEVILEVQDTGMGIPEGDLPNLFQKFFRVHRPGTAIRGTGLGLAITKHIVELQAGTITVQSTENVGSTFTVRFPQQ
ncbi:MAG: PAS domain S-box protein [Bacteroidota bacterium]